MKDGKSKRNSGKRIWLNFINRYLIQSGKLRRLIDKNQVTGIVSSASAVAACIAGDDEYRDEIQKLARTGMEAEAIYRRIVLEDAANAADLLLPVFKRTKGRDGFVGVDVSPEFAYDVETLIEEGHSLWGETARPNIMIQVPATTEAVPAIRDLLQGGINVNAILLYSLSRYRDVSRAYVTAMTNRLDRGMPVEGIASAVTFYSHPEMDPAVAENLRAESGDFFRRTSPSAAVTSGKAPQGVFQKGNLPDWTARGVQPQMLMWMDETDGAQKVGEFGCAGEWTPATNETRSCRYRDKDGKAPESMSGSGKERDDMEGLLDLLLEETIKIQVVQIDRALATMQQLCSNLS